MPSFSEMQRWKQWASSRVMINTEDRITRERRWPLTSWYDFLNYPHPREINEKVLEGYGTFQEKNAEIAKPSFGQ